ncbi:structural maintenance of chromosomes protein 5 [Topomyia yanbarensis]|uniref:structural maintenance of chromosomes protein 5 n=1 Tax=Topomyia yanbarensis TaxID=2498891 RepID=UPI00273C678C|nr:structural maintenance of chromosomes protein 5 [Topomyia yanbarensis]
MTSIIGKIKSVAVKDFVTYDVAIFYPDEHLNIIIGPNGTGKSTIVAAIVLGMGGHCKLLSRSGSIDDYIKNGKLVAKIEVALYKNAKRAVIMFNRTFDRDGKDRFDIDGTKVSHKDFLKRIRDLNIQIDNLCQFLPQDRVQDFTKMNPRELLLNTQSSVCSAQMSDVMEQLMNKRKEQKNVSKSSSDNLTKLKEAEAKNEELRAQIDTMNARKKFETEVEICNARKAWLEYEQIFTDYTAIKADVQLAKKNLDAKQKCLDPLKTKATKLNKTKAELNGKITQEHNEISKHSEQLRQMETKTEQMEDLISKQKRDLQDAISHAANRENELEQAKKALSLAVQDCKQAYQDMGSESDQENQKRVLVDKINKLKHECDLLIGRRNELNQKIENDLKPEMVSVQRRIESLENVGQVKLKLLQSQFDSTYQATLWLRDNQHLFRGKIYEPIILELNVLNSDNAKYLENTIGKRDLIAFTCEDRDDMALFLRKVRQEMRLDGVNVVFSEPAEELLYRPRIPIHQLERYGFSSYLIDMIDGPYPILNFLCKLYNLHNVPVGTNETSRLTSKIPDEIRLFFTPSNRFMISKSRYTGEKSSRCDELHTLNLLNKNVDPEVLDERKRTLQRLVKECDKIRNHRNQIEDQIKTVQDQCTELTVERRKIEEKFSRYQQIKIKTKRAEQKCADLQARLVDVSKEKAKFKDSCKKIIEDLMKAQQRKVTLLDQYVMAAVKHEAYKVKLSIFMNQNAELESEVRSAEDALDAAKKSHDMVGRKFDDVKERLKRKQIFAKGLTNNTTPTNDQFPYKREFEKLPDQLEELNNHMEELQARIDCMARSNGNILEEYETRCRQIESLRDAIRDSTKSSDALEAELQQLHDQWYPEISRVVEVINGNFTRFMSTMGFAGEVEITRNGERDYDEYGIQIRVKYRNTEKLQALDRHVQSGGERAVAIAIYTLSLQHITHVPFRCVDEINQGMDPRNERKVFEMLVDETCRPGQSQYFFVTPKLLPNLKYNDLMSVFIVHNGKFIQDSHVFVKDQLRADG